MNNRMYRFLAALLSLFLCLNTTFVPLVAEREGDPSQSEDPAADIVEKASPEETADPEETVEPEETLDPTEEQPEVTETVEQGEIQEEFIDEEENTSNENESTSNNPDTNDSEEVNLDNSSVIDNPVTEEEQETSLDVTDPSDFKYEITDGEVKITQYTGSDSQVIIPSEIDGAPVVTIGSYTFNCCDSVISVTIPLGVINIDDYAFSVCRNLTSVSIPDSVTRIGNWAFDTCGLTTITIPGSVTSIGDGAFYECTSLSSVIIQDGVQSIGYKAFYMCSSLTTITIPGSVTSIGESAFYECTSLFSITLAEGVISIGAGAFDNCNSLSSIIIPDSVTSIGGDAFFRCSNIKKITIGKGITSIPDGTYYSYYGASSEWFRGCTSLEEVILPSTMTYIGKYAFRSCSSLATIEIPGSVTSIGEGAFAECSNLKKITIGEGITSIPDSIGETSSYWFRGCTSLEEVVLPDSLTSIGNGAFSGCSDLTTIIIPDSVTRIGSYVFYDCSSLETFIIPDNITNIDKYTFYNCSSLTTIEIPDSVTRIGDYVFSGCSSLVSIEIPESVINIGIDLFYECSSLSSVAFPEGITQIPAGALYYCSSLTSFDIPANVTRIGSYAFCGCNNLSSIIIPDNVEYIFNSAFASCSSLTTITIPEGVKNIDDFAFFGCSNLSSITLPESITSIGQGSFENCTSLSSITIPENVTRIGQESFKNCTSLTSITLPDKVTEIKWNAFNNCSDLAYIIIPVSVQEIKADAFLDCDKLKTVYYCGTEEEWDAIYSTDWGLRDDVVIIFNYVKLHFIDNPCIVVYASQSVNIPKGMYGILVRDMAGSPLEGVTVHYSSQEMETDSDGLAIFTMTANPPVITASKNGYITWTNQETNWKANDNRLEEIRLYGIDAEKYLLKKADFVGKTGSVDLLKNTKKIGVDLSKANNYINTGNMSKTIRIECEAVDPSGIEKYALIYGNNTICDSSDGALEIKKEDLSAGGDYYIGTQPKGSKDMYKTHINLSIFDLSKLSKTGFSIKSDKISISIGDNVPFVGGSTLSVKLPPNTIPYDIVVTDESLYIGVNCKLGETEEDIQKAKDKYYDLLKDVNKLGKSIKDPKKYNQKMKALAKKTNTMKFSLFKDIEWHIIGFGEADWSKSALKIQLIVSFRAKGSYEHMFLVPVVVTVPITLEIDWSAGADGINEVKVDYENWKVSGNVSIKPVFELEPFLGVGATEIVAAGIYGDGKIDGDIKIIGINPGLQTIDLEGSLSFRGYLGPWELKKKFAYGKWNLYTKNTVGTNSVPYTSMYHEEGEMDAKEFTVADTSYLYYTSNWLGNRMYAADRSVNELVLNSLQTGVYLNSQPVTTSDPDHIYLAFLKADPNTNHVSTAITSFDGNSWKEPVVIDNEAIMDDAPQLAVDNNGNLWAAYTRATDRYDKTDLSLLNYAQTRELVLARLNKNTFEVLEERVYPAEGFVYGQKLAVVDGQLILAWIDADVTDDNSVVNPGNGKVYQVTVTDNNDAPVLEGLSDQTIMEIEIGKYNGNTAVVCTVAENNGKETDLYLASEGILALLYSGVTGNVSYGNMPGSNTPDFVWNGIDTLRSLSGGEIEASGISGYYSLCDGLYYSSGVSDITENMEQYHTGFREILMTDEGYSNDVIQLLNTRYLENVSVQELHGIKYVIGLNTQADISDDLALDKDLVFGIITEINDLQISDYDIDESSVDAGTPVPLSLTITNNGNEPIYSINIDVNGQINTQDLTINAGESAVVTTTITYPESATEYRVAVTGAGKIETEERYLDNEISFVLGQSDLVLESTLLKSAERMGINAVITNTGNTVASGTLTIHNSEGTLIYSETFENLSKEDILNVDYWLSEEELAQAGEYATVTVQSDQEDADPGNNQAQISFEWDYELAVIDETYASVSLDQNEAYLKAGEYLSLNYSIDLEEFKDLPVTWDSSDEEVAIVDQNGNVQALSEGRTVITASIVDEGSVAECIVYVSKSGVVQEESDVLYEDIPADGIIPDGIWIAGIKKPDYNGSKQTQTFRVYDHTTMLKSGKDYTVSYKNNTKAYTGVDENGIPANPKTAPSVTIKMKGLYKGSKTVYFNINPADISESVISPVSVSYNPKGQKPSPKVIWKNKTLKKGTDYTVSYIDSSDNVLNTVKEPGEYTIVITGKGNYAGSTAETTLIVAPADKTLTPVSRLKVTFDKNTCVYNNGEPVVPKVTVKNGKKVLTEGTDYILTIPEYTKTGTGYVTIEGIGSYTGTRKDKFTITGTSIAKRKVTGLTTAEYDGTKKELTGYEVSGLVKDTDYEVSYLNNTNAGKATIVFKGVNAYTGTLKKTFTITALDLTKAYNAGMISYNDGITAVYTKSGAKPIPVIRFTAADGTVKTLRESVDYKVSYANNKTVTNNAQMIVKGTGNFKGSITIPFSITKAELADCVTINAGDKKDTKKANNFKQTVKVLDENGKVLKVNTDYKLRYLYEDGTEIPAKTIVPLGTVVIAEVTAADTSPLYTGTICTQYRIVPAAEVKDISKGSFKIKRQEYTGKAVTIDEEDFSVMKVNKKVVPLVTSEAEDGFMIVGYSNNIRQGTAYVTLKGTGSYSGTKVVSFVIGKRTIGTFWTGIIN
ncbi:MAG: leucine-rich repeat protein, partial [Solobacterium sp.]|nr:leucine-rich repeat protein [Solobacterium sp.]